MSTDLQQESNMFIYYNLLYELCNYYMKSLIIILFYLTISAIGGYVAPLYAEWAHHHLVWINGK